MVLVDIDIINGTDNGYLVFTGSDTINTIGEQPVTPFVYNNFENTSLPVTQSIMSLEKQNQVSVQTTTSTGSIITNIQNAIGWFLFKGITIPQGSNIISAVFRMQMNNTNAVTTGNLSAGKFRVYGRKTASPTNPSFGSFSTSLTTGDTGFPQATTAPGAEFITKPNAVAFAQDTAPYDTGGAFSEKNVDIKTIVQELVNAFDYDNDNIMLTVRPLTQARPVITSFTVGNQAVTFNQIAIKTIGAGNPDIPNLIIIFQAGQICVPISDISNVGSWEDTTLGNGDTELWDELDEETADDNTTAVRGKQNADVADTFEVKLENCADPVLSNGHVIRIRAKGVRDQVKIQLFQGAVLIAESGDFALTGEFTTFEYTLSGGEADAITDYNDLRIRVVPSVVP